MLCREPEERSYVDVLTVSRHRLDGVERGRLVSSVADIAFNLSFANAPLVILVKGLLRYGQAINCGRNCMDTIGASRELLFGSLDPEA